ncbi:MAG: hypothetical protein ABR593_09065 [Candidatus Limnocylindria bacterium]
MPDLDEGPPPARIDEAAFRLRAREFLRRALAKLEKSHLIPLSPYESPWLSEHAVRWAVGDELIDEFALDLRAAFPQRFTGDPKASTFYGRSRGYPVPLVRAVVARSAVAHEQPTSDSVAADDCVDELATIADGTDQLFRLIQVVDGLDVEQVDGVDLEGVRLYPAPWRAELGVSRFMPEAVHANESMHLLARGPAAILVADGRSVRDPWEVAGDLRSKMLRVVTALRLVTAGTINETSDFLGEPTMVHVMPPEATPIPWEEIFDWWHRPATITAEMVPGIARVTALMDDWGEDLPSLIPAIGRYNRSFRPAIWQDSVVDLAVALEAALAGDSQHELALTLKSRAAHLLATEGDPEPAIWDDVEDLYDMRSRIVHGDVIPKRRWDAVLARARVPEKHFDRVRLSAAKDRWRDLLRRAILARLTLAGYGEEEKLWTAKPKTKVDRALVDPDQRAAWREAFAARCRALGITGANEAAPPLVDRLERRRDGQAGAPIRADAPEEPSKGTEAQDASGTSFYDPSARSDALAP